MAQFQLIFKPEDRPEWSEMRDTAGGEPNIDGQPLVDGTVFTLGGFCWQATLRDEGTGDRSRNERDDFKRFLCTPFPLMEQA